MLKVTDLSVKRGEKIILENVNFEVHENKLISLVGPSGCGKTSVVAKCASLVSNANREVILCSKKC